MNTDAKELINESTFELTRPEDTNLVEVTGNLIDQAGRVAINDQDDMVKATDLVKLLKTTKKQAEDKRVATVKPLNDAVKAINSDWKVITSSLDKSIKAIESLMTGYAREQQRIEKERREAEIKRQEDEALKLAESLEANVSQEAADDHVGRVAMQTSIARNTRVNPQTRGNLGGVSSMRSALTYKIDDLSKVPLKYLMIDSAKVQAAIREHRDIVSQNASHLKGKEKDAYIREHMTKVNIPGLEFYYDEKVVVR